MQIFKFPLGLTQILAVLDTNMLVSAKILHWVDYPMPGPEASSFASQWNIGLKYLRAERQGGGKKHEQTI